MAILTIREGYTGHQAGGEADNKTATRRFSLVTDDPADDAVFTWPQNDPTDTTIIIPAAGTFYPGLTDRRSREPNVKKVSPCFFNVEVRYGEDIDSTGKKGEDEWAANPLNKPATQRWDTNFSSELVSEDVNVISLEDLRMWLEEDLTYYDCLIDDFSNEEITILDRSNAIVECDEHAKFEDLFEEGVFYESIDRVKLTLVKVDGDWKISIYELLSSEEVTQ